MINMPPFILRDLSQNQLTLLQKYFKGDVVSDSDAETFSFEITSIQNIEWSNTNDEVRELLKIFENIQAFSFEDTEFLGILGFKFLSCLGDGCEQLARLQDRYTDIVRLNKLQEIGFDKCINLLKLFSEQALLERSADLFYQVMMAQLRYFVFHKGNVDREINVLRTHSHSLYTSENKDCLKKLNYLLRFISSDNKSLFASEPPLFSLSHMQCLIEIYNSALRLERESSEGLDASTFDRSIAISIMTYIKKHTEDEHGVEQIQAIIELLKSSPIEGLLNIFTTNKLLINDIISPSEITKRLGELHLKLLAATQNLVDASVAAALIRTAISGEIPSDPSHYYHRYLPAMTSQAINTLVAPFIKAGFLNESQAAFLLANNPQEQAKQAYQRLSDSLNDINSAFLLLYHGYQLPKGTELNEITAQFSEIVSRRSSQENIDEVMGNGFGQLTYQSQAVVIERYLIDIDDYLKNLADEVEDYLSLFKVLYDLHAVCQHMGNVKAIEKINKRYEQLMKKAKEKNIHVVNDTSDSQFAVMPKVPDFSVVSDAAHKPVEAFHVLQYCMGIDEDKRMLFLTTFYECVKKGSHNVDINSLMGEGDRELHFLSSSHKTILRAYLKQLETDVCNLKIEPGEYLSILVKLIKFDKALSRATGLDECVTQTLQTRLYTIYDRLMLQASINAVKIPPGTKLAAEPTTTSKPAYLRVLKSPLLTLWGNDRRDKYKALDRIAKQMAFVAQLPLSDDNKRQTIRELFAHFVVIAAVHRHDRFRTRNFWDHGLTTSRIDFLIDNLLDTDQGSLQILFENNVNTSDFLQNLNKNDFDFTADPVKFIDVIKYVANKKNEKTDRKALLKAMLRAVAQEHYQTVLSLDSTTANQTREEDHKEEKNQNRIYLNQARSLFFKPSPRKSKDEGSQKDHHKGSQFPS